jgi:allophanate hydrolase
MRLDGPCLQHRAGADIVSDAVLPGAVQVPGDGRPLVLMRDCQTTGGYPKIACVIAADLDRLAQCRSGIGVRFAEVSPESGLAATRDCLRRLQALPGQLVAADATQDRLHHANLIGGVHDARPGPPDG